jgi:hypothetical protein
VTPRSRTRIALAASVLLGPLVLPAVHSSARTAGAEPTPSVQGPVTGGSHGRAFNEWPWSLRDYGYQQAEYFISGTARAYGTKAAPAPYKVRIQVMRPVNPRKASGTAVVEWSNVTAGYEIPLGWVWTHPYVMKQGDVFLAVGVQEAGVCGNMSPDPSMQVCSPTSLRGWDPARYGPLHHPGDQYAFDIYSQAVQAVLKPGHVNPVAGLQIKHVIAYGQSQSAKELDPYLCNGADATARVIDAALIDGDGGRIPFTCRPRVPVIKLWSEESATPVRSTSGPNRRIWMIPGAPHEDGWQTKYEEAWTNYNNLGLPPSLPTNRAMQADAGNYGQQGLPGAADSVSCLPSGDAYPRRYVDDAAVQALKDWVINGTPAPSFPSVVFAAPGPIDTPVSTTTDYEHDQYFNTLGGLRSPVLDVPVATYIGPTCVLSGETVPFTAVQLSQLYPTHKAYVDKMFASIQTAVRKGSLISMDAADLMQRACGSSIGGPAVGACPAVKARSPYHVGMRH